MLIHPIVLVFYILRRKYCKSLQIVKFGNSTMNYLLEDKTSKAATKSSKF